MPTNMHNSAKISVLFCANSMPRHKAGEIRLSLPWSSLQIDLFENVLKVSEVAQSCPTLCDPMDCSLPDSSIHGIFQARILEWFAISFSRRPSQPRDRTQVSRIVGRCFTIWATSKVRLWKGLRLQTIWGLTVTMWVSTSGLNLKPAQFYLWTF